MAERIVEFDKYCQKCKHKGTSSFDEPCDSCLEYPANLDSRKPLYFEAEDKTESQGRGKNT